MTFAVIPGGWWAYDDQYQEKAGEEGRWHRRGEQDGIEHANVLEETEL